MKVADYMTFNVQSVFPSTTVQEALQMMDVRGFRHLLVMDRGTMLGLVSHRELTLLTTLPNLDARRTSVEMAMVSEPLSFDEATPLPEVAGRMAEFKMGSAVITRDGKPLGIFTTTDALRALQTLLTRLAPDNARSATER